MQLKREIENQLINHAQSIREKTVSAHKRTQSHQIRGDKISSSRGPLSIEVSEPEGDHARLVPDEEENVSPTFRILQVEKQPMSGPQEDSLDSVHIEPSEHL